MHQSDIERIMHKQYEYKPGGTWTGSPHGVFLYEYMIHEPWLFNVQRPPTHLFNGRTFCLLENLHYWPAGHNVAATAHAGGCSDGGTIRTVMGWATLSTPFRDYLLAFLIHDQICRQAKRLLGEGRIREAIALRLHGDNLFRVMILDIAIARNAELPEDEQSKRPGRWDSWLGYRAVRAGAGISGLT